MNKVKLGRISALLSFAIVTASLSPAYAGEEIISINEYGPLNEGNAIAQDKVDKNKNIVKTEQTVKTDNKSFNAISPDISSISSFNMNLNSDYCVLYRFSDNKIMMSKNMDSIISPASMIKLLTVLVAADHISEYDKEFEIKQSDIDYGIRTGCCRVGFKAGEKVKIKDLFYGTIMKSGADAAMALSRAAAGTYDNFVSLMNEKAKALGLSEGAYFTNAVGIYNENHHCSVRDIAIIMRAVYEVPILREMAATRTLKIYPSEHSEGILLHNLFLERIDKRALPGNVLAAKTGYIQKAGFCAASIYEAPSGEKYIAVSAKAPDKWKNIDDHENIYKAR